MLAMLLGILPCVSPPAYAADATPWTRTDGLPDSEGSYKLTGNVTIASTWEISQDITLDLNGYGILCTASNSVIEISDEKQLTLNDSNPNSRHYITLDEQGCGTAVSDSAPSGEEGVDYIVVNGGCITGGRTNGTVGGGVYVSSGNFTMNGGTIAGSAWNNVGGVSLSGSTTFTMEGGTITRNTARKGGGVFVYPGSNFIMRGGTIEDNETSGINDSGCREVPA